MSTLYYYPHNFLEPAAATLQITPRPPESSARKMISKTPFHSLRVFDSHVNFYTKKLKKTPQNKKLINREKNDKSHKTRN